MATTVSVTSRFPSTRARVRAAAIVAAAVVSTTVIAGRVTAARSDDEADAGTVAIVDAYERSNPLTHGDGATEFTLQVPTGATCPGDSANDQWRVDSFIVPEPEDPAAIHYGAIGPEPVGNGHYAMFGTDTVPYVFELTQRNPGSGLPGIILPLPPFDFTVVAGEQIPSGNYRIGVACTDRDGVTKRYWDTEIVLTDPPGHKPGRLTWRLSTAPEAVFRSNHTTARWMAPTAGGVGAAAAGGIGWFTWRRRARRVSSLSKEHS